MGSKITILAEGSENVGNAGDDVCSREEHDYGFRAADDDDEPTVFPGAQTSVMF